MIFVRRLSGTQQRVPFMILDLLCCKLQLQLTLALRDPREATKAVVCWCL